jgi:hypothetical protein
MEVSGQIHAPATLPPEKSRQYPLHRKLGSLQSQSGQGGEKQHICPCRKSNPDSPVFQPVA